MVYMFCHSVRLCVRCQQAYRIVTALELLHKYKHIHIRIYMYIHIYIDMISYVYVGAAYETECFFLELAV